MKTCPNCNAQINDNDQFCTSCGQEIKAETSVVAADAKAQFDHTSEFDPKDISDNKVISMLVYLLGPIGILLALLAAQTSPYAGFHVRQSLKFTVIETLTMLASGVLVWTFIVPIAGVIFLGVLAVVKIICFFQICKGYAKEPAIIRGFKFLK